MRDAAEHVRALREGGEMKLTPIPALIQPAIDIEQISKEIAAKQAELKAKEEIEKRDQEAAEEAKEASISARNVSVVKAKTARKSKASADHERLELGRLLMQARKAWPERGPKAKGWGEFLAKMGIEEQSARNYMQLAGYVNISKPDESGLEIPSRREIARAKRAPDAPEPVDTEDAIPQRLIRTISRDIDNVLDGLLELAKKLNPVHREELASTLQRALDLIGRLK